MSEHPQAGAIRRAINELDSLAGAAQANGDDSVERLLLHARALAEMALDELNKPPAYTKLPRLRRRRPAGSITITPRAGD